MNLSKAIAHIHKNYDEGRNDLDENESIFYDDYLSNIDAIDDRIISIFKQLKIA